MAIRMMTSESKAHLPNVETVRDYPGHEAGLIRHGKLCVHHGKRDTSGEFSPDCARAGMVLPGESEPLKAWSSGLCSGPFRPLYLETTHVGLVLALGEYNGRDDSDFYAVVWNAETGRPERVTYASTRGWSYPNGASVDATPEVRAAFKAYQAEQAEQARKAREAARIAAERKAARDAVTTPAKGDTVRVVRRRGRNVPPKGTTGLVFWTGTSSMGTPRLGIALDDERDARGRHVNVGWTPASNVEIVRKADGRTLAEALEALEAELEALA